MKWLPRVLILLSLVLPHLGHAAIYYVAKTGSDSNSGALEAPKLTVVAGIALLTAGDTLYIREGVYTEAITTSPSGTSWTNAVTIAAYPSETVTLRPSGVESVIDLPGAAYVILHGLTIDAINVSHGSCIGDGGPGGSCTGYGLSMGATGGHHIRFQYGTIMNGYGVNVQAFAVGAEFLHSVFNNSRWSYGFYVQAADVIIAHSDIINNGGYAIQIYNGYANDADNIQVYNNRMWNNGIRRQVSAMTVDTGENCKIYNNLIYHNYGGIDVHGTAEKVYNNTIYRNSPRAGIELSNYDGTPVIQNNIVYQNANDIVDYGGGTVTLSNNLTTDPSFRNPLSQDFTLLPGSAARNAGTTVGTVTTDFAGVARPQGAAYDIGAYESP